MTEEKAIKDLSTRGKDSEQNKAIARLNSIPSEIETMLFLHDQGKILYHAPEDTQMWLNRDNGVDISFADGVHLPGYTDMGVIDVKNVELRRDGTNYPNLFIEFTKYRQEKYAWGYHYTDGSTGRYIAYVRDGKQFGGKLATETEVYSLDKTERENARELVKYYAKHQELLTHDIYIVRGDDVGQEIVTEKGNWIKEGYILAELSHWRLKYPLMEVRRTAEGWTVKHTGKGTFDLTTATQAQRITDSETKHTAHEVTKHTAEEVERRIDKHLERWKQRQRDGLTEAELLEVYGLAPEAAKGTGLSAQALHDLFEIDKEERARKRNEQGGT